MCNEVLKSGTNKMPYKKYLERSQIDISNKMCLCYD